jgi:hypothetical protein
MGKDFIRSQLCDEELRDPLQDPARALLFKECSFSGNVQVCDGCYEASEMYESTPTTS